MRDKYHYTNLKELKDRLSTSLNILTRPYNFSEDKSGIIHLESHICLCDVNNDGDIINYVFNIDVSKFTLSGSGKVSYFARVGFMIDDDKYSDYFDKKLDDEFKSLYAQPGCYIKIIESDQGMDLYRSINDIIMDDILWAVWDLNQTNRNYVTLDINIDPSDYLRIKEEVPVKYFYVSLYMCISRALYLLGTYYDFFIGYPYSEDDMLPISIELSMIDGTNNKIGYFDICIDNDKKQPGIKQLKMQYYDCANTAYNIFNGNVRATIHLNMTLLYQMIMADTIVRYYKYYIKDTKISDIISAPDHDSKKIYLNARINLKVLTNGYSAQEEIDKKSLDDQYDITERGKNMNNNEAKYMLLHLRSEGQSYTYNNMIEDIIKNIEVCFKQSLGDESSKYSIFNIRYAFYYSYNSNKPSEIEYVLNITAPMYLEGIPYFVIESIVPSGTLFYSRLYKRGIEDDINTVKVFPINVNLLQPSDIPTIIGRELKDNFDMTELFNMYIDLDVDMDVLEVYDTTDINIDYVNFGKQSEDKKEPAALSNTNITSTKLEDIFTCEQMADFIEKLDLKSEVNKMIVKKLYVSLGEED